MTFDRAVFWSAIWNVGLGFSAVPRGTRMNISRRSLRKSLSELLRKTRQKLAARAKLWCEDADAGSVWIS